MEFFFLYDISDIAVYYHVYYEYKSLLLEARMYNQINKIFNKGAYKQFTRAKVLDLQSALAKLRRS